MRQDRVPITISAPHQQALEHGLARLATGQETGLARLRPVSCRVFAKVSPTELIRTCWKRPRRCRRPLTCRCPRFALLLSHSVVESHRQCTFRTSTSSECPPSLSPLFLLALHPTLTCRPSTERLQRPGRANDPQRRAVPLRIRADRFFFLPELSTRRPSWLRKAVPPTGTPRSRHPWLRRPRRGRRLT